MRRASQRQSDSSFYTMLHEFTDAHVARALRESGGNIKQGARLLDVKRSTFYGMVRAYRKRQATIEPLPIKFIIHVIGTDAGKGVLQSCEGGVAVIVHSNGTKEVLAEELIASWVRDGLVRLEAVKVERERTYGSKTVTFA